jgi:hypothetical protein
MNFATFTHFSVSVVSSAATEMSHEDTGRGKLCIERRIKKYILIL